MQRWLGGLLLAVPLLARAEPLAPPTPPVELAGTWHVLVHYRDAETAQPQRLRGEDRVWVFAPEPAGLRWTEYPIVVFRDDSGRFEPMGGNRRSRVLHAWEPNAGQLQQIHGGLEVNSRGSKTKLLEGSSAEGWRSSGAPRPASASVITYSETWSIDDPRGLPVFVREDFLSSARAVGMEGRTEYRTEEVLEGGDLLRGSFGRDETRVGTFRMLRAGAVGKVKGRGRVEGVHATQLLMRQAGPRLVERESLRALLAAAAEQGTPSEATRRAVRREIRSSLEEHVRAQDESPARLRAEIEHLTRQIERALLDEGESLEEVRRLLEGQRPAP